MNDSARAPLRAAAWMTLAQLFFSGMAVGARLGGRFMPWPEVCASRFFVGAVTAYAVGRATGKSLRITRVREAWLRSAFGTLSAAGTFYVYAAPALAIGDAATLFATSPIFVALLSAPLLGEAVRPASVLGLALGFAGLALVAQPSFSSAGHLVTIGTATAVTAAMAMIWLRRIGPNESSEAIVLHFSCVGLAVMLLLSIPGWRTPGPREVLLLAGTGLCGGLGQLTMTRAYALDRAARVSSLSYSGIVFTRMLALPLFGEVPALAQVLGSLLVIGSGLALTLADHAAARRR